ncbi:hypothetical protein E2C01_070368 [Portunus trituberculatus]|uniref:Uncharacterized protein n=1 Tax=Portunus trituberculatus TaxID=210409 RepID=A0A5B7I3B4_PORTR|nr:hypothetical protein [Portunus trituberculatus]
MGLYRSDSSPQPWVRKQSRIIDVALTRLRLGHTRHSTPASPGSITRPLLPLVQDSRGNHRTLPLTLPPLPLPSCCAP